MQHPDWQVDFLVTDHCHLPFYLERFPCDGLHRASSWKEDLSSYSRVIFPLLNRGYAGIKRCAWALGSKRFEVDYRGNLRVLRLSQLVTSIFRATHRPISEFQNFMRQFPFPYLGRSILVVESTRSELPAEDKPKLESVFPADAQIHRVAEGSLLQTWRHFRHKRIDGAVVYLSADKGFRALRFLPFLLRLKSILVISGDSDFTSGNPIQVAGFFLRRFVFSSRSLYGSPRILFLQTEGPEYTFECLRRLREKALFPYARILLISREEDRGRLEGLEGVVKTVCWKKGGRISQILRIRRQVKKFRPNLNCAAFTGRPVFRLQKLAYFLLGSRRKLAFNAGHDAYWLALGTIHRIFKKEPFQFPQEKTTKVLMLESSSEANMLAALQTVQEDQVVPNACVTLFCREDKRGIFESSPGVEGTITYSRNTSLKELPVLWRLFRMRPDVLAAVFAGSRIYPKHRLLFWLLPARSRLAFNQNLDCFYVNRKTFHLLFSESSGTPKSWLRYGLRAAFFLPRFLYLLAWRAGWKFRLMRPP